ATGVRVLDGLSLQSTDYKAKVIFLCASTLNSTWILLRSATDIWPGGLGSSSGELGHNLMDHHFRVGAEGRIEGFDDKDQYGRKPNSIYVPRYRNLFGEKRDYLRGFGYEGSANRQGWSRAVAEMGIGGGFKDSAAEPGAWSVGGSAFGEMLPNHANTATLDQTKKDKWGLPVLNIHNQVWDAPNVFVTDGSCMASTACQNPSLTYMALTARAADFAVSELNKRNL